MFITGEIHTLVISILVDTGVSISCLHPNTLQKIQTSEPNLALNQKKYDSIVGINGKTTNIIATVTLTIKLGTFQATFDFQIINIGKKQCILGRNFLEKQGAVIDFGKKIMKLQNGKP